MLRSDSSSPRGESHCARARRALLGLATGTTFALLAIAAGPIASARAADAKPALTVAMKDEAPFYTPAKATIKVGQTVEWVNKGTTVHDVSTNVSNARNPKDVELPKAAKPFDSGFIPPGGKFRYTFTVPGKYKYFCVPHEDAGMVGYLTVEK